jgi:AAA ATPase domain
MYSTPVGSIQMALSGVRSVRSGTGHKPSCVRSGLSTVMCDITTAVPQAPPNTGIIRREGEYWTVGYGEKVFRLKDSKGLAQLLYLLRNPGVEVHAMDLIRLAAGIGAGSPDGISSGLSLGREQLRNGALRIGGLGDAGELIDDVAKMNYRRRLSELRSELEEAKHLDRVDRAAAIEMEIDALTRELSRAVGLGGRVRRAASASERARQTVTKTIRAGIERIARHHEELARILSTSIQTGTVCCYHPDWDIPIAWQFGAGSRLDPIQPTMPDAHPSKLMNVRQVAARVKAPPLATHPLHISSHHFVGREGELRELSRLMALAKSGHGSLIMITGGLGVGKTRFAMEAAERARQCGFTSLAGRCYESDEPCPFLPLAEMLETCLTEASDLAEFRRKLGPFAAEMAQIAPSLRRVFPDIPPAPQLPPRQARRHLLQSCVGYLAHLAHGGPLLVILDDLHWADESSLALLTYLGNRISQLPMIMIGLYRDVDLDTSPVLFRTLDELIRMGLRPKRLMDLSLEEVDAMLHGLSGLKPPADLSRVIFEKTHGNPFFVQELYEFLASEGTLFDTRGDFRALPQIGEMAVPESVRLVLGRRLKRLGDDTRRILTSMAVIGRSCSFSVLRALMDQINLDNMLAIIEESQRLGLVHSTADGAEAYLVFTDEQLRQTLLADVSTPRLQRLHLDAAQALEKVHAHSLKQVAGEIAYHLGQAGSLAEPLVGPRYRATAPGFELASATEGTLLRLSKRQDAKFRFSPDDRVLKEQELPEIVDNAG